MTGLMWIGRAMLALAILGLGAGACSSKGGQAGPSAPKKVCEPSIAREDLPDCVATAVCEVIADCCADKSYAFSESQCHAAIRSEYAKSLDEYEKIPNQQYDGSGGPAYIDDLLHGLEHCSTETPSGWPGIVFKGTRQEGESCDPQSANQCARSFDCLSGTCKRWPTLSHGKESDPCAGTCRMRDFGSDIVPECSIGVLDAAGCWAEDGLYCHVPPGSETKATCQRLVLGQRLRVGEACSGPSYVLSEDSPDSCEAGLYCPDGKLNGWTPNVCTAQQANGQPCDTHTNEECRSGYCKCDANSCHCAEDPMINQMGCLDGQRRR